MPPARSLTGYRALQTPLSELQGHCLSGVDTWGQPLSMSAGAHPEDFLRKVSSPRLCLCFSQYDSLLNTQNPILYLKGIF